MRGYLKISAALFVGLSAATPAHAKDFGKHGTVYEIAETPLFEMIQKSIQKLADTGKLDELNEELKRNSIETIEAPSKVAGLDEVVEPYSFVFDPAITIQEDIDDGQGKVIAYAGTVVNPLEHVALGDELLFIRGDKASHLALAQKIRDEKNGKIKVIFVSGEPLKAMREGGYRVYFDQGGAMIKRFQITRVPALVSQDGLVLNIEEIPADVL